MSTGILCSWLRLFIHRWNLQPLQGFAQRCTSVLRLLQALALSKEANVFFDGLVLSLCKRCTMVAHLTTILHALHGTSAPHLWSVQVYPQCIQPAYLRKVYHATASLAYTTSSVKILHVPCTGQTEPCGAVHSPYGTVPYRSSVALCTRVLRSPTIWVYFHAGAARCPFEEQALPIGGRTVPKAHQEPQDLAHKLRMGACKKRPGSTLKNLYVHSRPKHGPCTAPHDSSHALAASAWM